MRRRRGGEGRRGKERAERMKEAEGERGSGFRDEKSGERGSGRVRESRT